MGKLTGKVRHRRGWWGAQILQVQVIGRPYSADGGGAYGPEYTAWRDATEFDLTEISVDGELL